MTELAPTQELGTIERVIATGDLSRMSGDERARYYLEVCSSIGLNPLSQPFQYLTLQGKMILYARKDATDQLRALRRVSLTITAREIVNDLYVVTARAVLPDGRTDEEIGAVPIAGLKGEALANAMMKASTKSKRRVTLSICGLGMLDETEFETIPGARHVPLEEMHAPAEAGPSPNARRIRADLDAAMTEEMVPAPIAVPSDEVEHLTGEALAEACRRLQVLLEAAKLPYAPFPTPRTVNAYRDWWRSGMALLAASARPVAAS